MFGELFKKVGKMRKMGRAVFLFFVAAFLVFLVDVGKSDPYVLAGDTGPLELVAVITLKSVPTGIVVNEKTNLVYVSTEEGLAVIDGGTNEIIEEIPLDGEAWVLAADPQNNRIYTRTHSEKKRGRIKVIDGATHSVVGEIPESAVADEFAVNPVTNIIYIADRSATMGWPDTVEVYDGETLEHLTTIEIPGSSEVTTIRRVGVAVNPDSNMIYVVWNYESSVFAVDGDTNEIVNKVLVPPWDTFRVKSNRYTNYVYVEFDTEVLDGKTLENVTSSYKGSLRAVDPLHNVLYTRWLDELYALDGSTHNVGAKLTVEHLDDVAVNSKTGRIYITHREIGGSEPVGKVSVVQGPLSPFRPAEFVVSDLMLEEEEVEAGEYCEVTVKVTNVGELEDLYIVELRAAGSVKDKKGVTLLSGESETVSLMFYEEEPGTHEVEVDGQKGIITVHTSSYVLYGVAVIATIVVLAVLVKRVRSSRKRRVEVKRRAPKPSPVPI